MVLTGGCLCGAVRYRIDGELTAEGAGFCHCSLCRRASGAPAVAWGTWRTPDFRFTGGEPAEYRSSPKGIRRFCPTCGSQLTFHYTEGPENIDVTLATLDDPGAVKPQYHVWCGGAVPALDVSADLPRYAEGGSDFTPY
ncbi:GFA family protein [Skermanella mucosa]|uniref:GFA family protein n=1 Tax=Skermanella mucosa TaxID=1789672 RepID=UPI00192AC235|nr:GFA family protein [Skermanella mucosa]UEM22782.1 GFA family protein [Skermanella mucosa]